VKTINLEFVKVANNFISNMAAQKRYLVIWPAGRHSLEGLILGREDNI